MVLSKMIRFLRYDYPTLYQVLSLYHFTEGQPPGTGSKDSVPICDGVMLKIYLEHTFQWPQERLNYESLAYKVVT